MFHDAVYGGQIARMPSSRKIEKQKDKSFTWAQAWNGRYPGAKGGRKCVTGSRKLTHDLRDILMQNQGRLFLPQYWVAVHNDQMLSAKVFHKGGGGFHFE